MQEETRQTESATQHHPDLVLVDDGLVDDGPVGDGLVGDGLADDSLADDGGSGIDIDPEDLRPRPWGRPRRSRVLAVLGVICIVLLLIFLPPLISVNRYRRQIATSIGRSLGRPVHMDSVTLNLLPMPGFTLENFVVSEDAGFGAEPVIQARSVTAALRVGSLWRRRIEFSRITLDEPSVNLVHRADGRWNIESILLQASKIEAAPTAQKVAGDAPRFPYIEATGARVNVKMGLEKMPLALSEAEFALWLPEPRQWRLRLEGHPARTDTASTDTGLVRIQGTLGKAATLQDVPVDLTAEWRNAPLGGVSWVLVGRDAGFRGEMALRASVKGTVGLNAVESRLELAGLRRADFVPRRTLDADLTCRATASDVFHQFRDVRCGLPSDLLDNPKLTGASLQGDVPRILEPAAAEGVLTLANVDAGLLLDALRIVSPRISPNLSLSGALEGKLSGWTAAEGDVAIAKARLALGEGKPFLDGDVAGAFAGQQLTMEPIELDLGGPQPALLDAHMDRSGYALHLSGTVLRTRLLALARALPPFGDGLEEALPPAPEDDAAKAPIKVDLVSTRTWAGGQSWSAEPNRPPRGKKLRNSGHR